MPRMLYRKNKKGGRGRNYCEYVSQAKKSLPKRARKKMTVKQRQRAGRLQEEGCSEYGKDDSRSTNGSYYKRPLARQEVPFYNQRSSLSMRNSLVQSSSICRRKSLGRKNNKAKSSKGIPIHLCHYYKNNCFLDYILDAREKELQIQQGSRKHLQVFTVK